MRLHTIVVIGLLQCGTLMTSAQPPASAQKNSQAKPTAQQAKPPATQSTSDNPGEKKFRQNCSRCHNAPDELSSRITGTVLLHMRVRASLSAADERDIVRYLAP